MSVGGLMRLPFLVAVVLVGCGRTGLEAELSIVPLHDDAGPTDAGPPQPCPDSTRADPLGTVLWKTTLTTSSDVHYLFGPLAADSSGDTYYVYDPSIFSQPGEPSLISLDACGHVRWRVPWHHPEVRYVRVYLMVSGPRLIAQYADVEAFDLETGAHLWTADVAGLIGSSKGVLDTPVAAADGVVYLTATDYFGTEAKAEIVAIDPNGVPNVLASVPNVKATMSITDLILDSRGRLDLGLTGSNVFVTAGTPGTIHSFRRDGTLEFTTSVPNLDPSSFLMSGPGIVLNEASGTMLGANGGVTGQLGARAVWSAVMDAQRNIFAITAGDGPVVTKFDPTGIVRWKSAPFSGAPLNDPGSGPILGDGTHVFFVANVARSVSSSAVWTPVVTAIDVDTGMQAAMWPFEGSPPVSLVLTPAAQLVFTVGTDAVALSSGGERPPADAPWPTARGATDQRSAALGQ